MASYGQVKDSQTEQAEHVHLGTVKAKRVLASGWDGSNINDILVNSDGSIGTNGLVPEGYDYINLTYTGADLTKIEYYKGGSGGSVVATLDLTYSSNILQTITRS